MILPLLLSLAFPIASSLSNFPIVNTNHGQVRGYEYRANNRVVGQIFKKIPFASPPIGPRRWKKPVQPEPWNHTLDGTFFGPACAQHSSLWKGYVTGFSEDCLTLNIYTSKECRESPSSCPVVLYIHGGFALFDGTMMFPDDALVTNFVSKGIIMVTTAYRLGVFGVMALGDENVLPANLAMHDVLACLRFLQREIHNFGGDKDQVTIMGHSTGANMVIALAFSPDINKDGETPLFTRAIAMSFTANYIPEEIQVMLSHQVAENCGCEGSAQEIVDCLMLLSTDEVLQPTNEKGDVTINALTDITLAGELMPIRNLRDLRQTGKKVKLLLGTTMNEFQTEETTRESECPFTEEVKKMIEAQCQILGVVNLEECKQKHLTSCVSGNIDFSNSNLASQTTFLSTWLFANTQARAGEEVYLYQYDYPVHSMHADDVFYVMGFHEHPMDANEKWLSRVYPLYFTNFIKGQPLAPDWKRLDPDLMNYYSINKSLTDEVGPEMKLGYHISIMDYYEKLLSFDGELSALKKVNSIDPVEYKNLVVSADGSFNESHLLIASIILIAILFSFFKLYQCYEESKSGRDRSSLLKYS